MKRALLLTMGLAIVGPCVLAQAAPEVWTKAQTALDARDLELARTEAIAALNETTEDTPEEARLLDVLVEVGWRTNHGGDANVREWAEAAVRIKESTAAIDSLSLAVSWFNRAIILKNHEDLRAAETDYRRALQLRQRHLPPDHKDLAASHLGLGTIYFETGRYEQARSHYETSLQIREAITGPRSVAVANQLQRLGQLDLAQDMVAAAIEKLEQSVEMFRETDPRYTAIPAALSDLADAYEANLDPVSAHQALDAAVDWRRENDKPKALASALLRRGTFERDMGDLEAAARSLRESLDLRQRAYSPEHSRTLHVAERLAEVSLDLGNVAEAQELLEFALRVREQKANPRAKANTLLRLGRVQRSTGDYHSALRSNREAVRLYREADAPDEIVARAMNNVAVVEKSLGQRERAMATLQESLQLFRNSLGEDDANLVFALHNLAGMHLELDDLEPALALSLEARDLAQRSLRAEHGIHGDVLLRLAEIQFATRDDSAMATFALAIARIEEAFGADHPKLAWALERVGVAHLANGDVDEAFEAAQRAHAISLDHIFLTSRAFPERQSLRYLTEGHAGVDLLIATAVQHPSPHRAAAAWDAVAESRGMVLEEMAARRRAVTTSQDPALTELADELRRARQRLATGMVRGTAQRAQLEVLRQQREQAERNLARESQAFRQVVDARSTAWTQALDQLATTEAVVAYFQYRAHGDPLAQEREYCAFIATKTGGQSNLTCVDLGPVATIDTAVNDWRATILEEATRGQAAPLPSHRTGATLRQLVWDPLAPHLTRATHVRMVLDGGLHLVNFQALPTHDASHDDAAYLIETGPALVVLSTERDLSTKAATPASSDANGLLALGNVDFGPRQTMEATALRGTVCPRLAEVQFEPLPASGDEVRLVAGYWPANRRVILTGNAADETTFKKLAPGKRVLHLATHGFFLASCQTARPVRSGAGTRGIGGLSPRATGQVESLARTSPLLLAGLALAGANQRHEAQPERNDDGILTAEEIVELRLEGVEWAVLSACDSGTGRIESGEGVFGLRRAFELAGVQTVITSLWPVDDDATRRWMHTLYEAKFRRGLSTIEAVRATSLAQLMDLRGQDRPEYPFLWAGFTATGSPVATP